MIPCGPMEPSGCCHVLCEKTAVRGCLRILLWAQNHDCPWDIHTCRHSASSGHLGILHRTCYKNCPWDFYTCTKAAEGRRIDLLQCALSSSCSKDNQTFQEAAARNLLHVLEWACANDANLTASTTYWPLTNGQWEVLQRARANRCPPHTEACLTAVVSVRDFL